MTGRERNAAEELRLLGTIAGRVEEARQRDEALDVIATCIRFLCGEHNQESQK